MAKARPQLHRDSSRQRVSARNSVTIEGRCGIGGRELQEVLVTDLHAHGCRVRGVAVGVIKSEPLVLWLGEVGPVAGHLKWTKSGALGVAFEEPLAADLLEALCQAPSPSNVVPLRK